MLFSTTLCICIVCTFIEFYAKNCNIWEAAKKVLFLVAGLLRGGKGKKTFFIVRKKVPMATKPTGGGGLKALLAGPLRKELSFFAASLYHSCKQNKSINLSIPRILLCCSNYRVTS